MSLVGFGTIRRAVPPAALVFLAVAGPAAADSALWRSLVIPGSGQAHQGHYTKAALFATVAVASGVGVFVTQIHYNRAVERYESEKRTYLGFQRQLDAGREVRYADIQDTYVAMQDAFDESDNRVVWRNVFLGAAIATYVVNVVDVILSSPETGERLDPPAVSVEVRGDTFRVVRTIRF